MTKIRNSKSIVLASGSPRRKELLLRMGIDFNIMPCDADETYDKALSPEDVACYLSKLKATTVHRMVPDQIVIGADTIVVIEDEILGKPDSIEAAISMIQRLAGNWHNVITGVTVCFDQAIHTLYETTRVHFVEMSIQEIMDYVAQGESLDKAGAYGVQGAAGMYIDRIEGDYYNVMGLPMAMLNRMLKNAGAIDLSLIEG